MMPETFGGARRRAGLPTVPGGAFLLLLSACGAPSGTPVTLLGHEALAPLTWQSRPAGSPMRLAEFTTPGGSGQAEVMVYHFGPGQGGSAAANVDRWESQFTGEGGERVPAQVSTLEGTAFPTTLVELAGTYTRGVGMGAAGGARSGQALVAAVVETPGGNLFPQLFGPREDVAAEREAFVGFLRSIGTPGDGS